MKAFVWNRVSYVTVNWHDKGGIFVIAPDLESARGMFHDAGIPLDCEAFARDPDTILELVGEPEQQIVVFPDAGCC